MCLIKLPYHWYEVSVIRVRLQWDAHGTEKKLECWKIWKTRGNNWRKDCGYRKKKLVVWETACLGRSILRAAGGRVAQLIKTPVLMSQPVTPGRERQQEKGKARELPGSSWVAPNQPSRQQSNHPANPPRHMSDKPWHYALHPPFPLPLLCTQTDTHGQTFCYFSTDHLF